MARRDLRTALSAADAACLLLILAPTLYVGAANLQNTYDDAFITYRYAYNLATGAGFVYNPGEWFLGTTAPLYGLLLALLGWLAGPETIPSVSGGLSALSLAAGALALFVYGRLHEQRFCGAMAGLFFGTSPLLYATFGGEMLFQAALILWGFVAYRLGRPSLAAVLLALAALARPDGLVALGVLGLYDTVAKRRIPWRPLAWSAAILLPALLLGVVVYGSPLPSTLGAKVAQRTSGLWASFGTGMVEWVRAYTMQGSSALFPLLPAAPSAIRFVPLVALGVPALLRFRFWLLPLAWVAAYVAGYVLLDVPFYHWYIVPVAAALAILAGCGVAALAELGAVVGRWLAARVAPKLAAYALPASALVLVAALLPGIIAQVRDVQRLALQPDAVEELYAEAGRWLAANTPAGSSVGYFEVGYLGYYARRPIVDPLGLFNPTIAAHVADRQFTWAYEQYRPAYIINTERIFGEYIGVVTAAPWFQQEYRQVAVIEHPGTAPLTIYQRVVNR